ncbi:universal stress protein [Natrinema hispanicum]|uniref:Nucleotide-binding universal stress protein, UspA family n=1 Tax=Natrinema hispanicum TaxID=392421 RepID=A0A1I0IFD6_9EURY|nr:universal stress protein [Natrinema hispanicum]SDD58242.1 Nucleotide-binding universal stress protein, UspA family [Natrinema hispanicum]SET95534.1 Nucleotide-binding universal stress protein, UspA family [Natrinema hispanicum]
MRFLVAVDGSDEAESALDYALEIANAVDGSITVVHAVDPAVYDEGGSEPISTLSDADQRLVLESIEDAEQRGVAILEEMVEVAAERDVDVEEELLYGDPSTEIPDYAETEGFDAIYLGHRGRSERMERLLGSVAKVIVEQATVPVTVVR